jgi:hypothetical protein
VGLSYLVALFGSVNPQRSSYYSTLGALEVVRAAWRFVIAFTRNDASHAIIGRWSANFSVLNTAPWSCVQVKTRYSS